MKTRTAFASFVGVVVVANLLTQSLGLVHWLGLAATAGTWVAGFGFVARDYLQEATRPRSGRWVVAAILLGTAVTAAFSPKLAVASAAAFLFSELADYALYSPLRARGRTRAALASNVVGAVVDSILFLAIADALALDPFIVLAPAIVATQVAVKVGTTSAFVLGVKACSTWPTPAEARGR